MDSNGQLDLPEGLEGVIESITKLILHDIQRR